MSGNGIQPIDDLGVFSLQHLCFLHIIIRSVKRKYIHIKTYDAWSFPLLN